MAETSCPLLMSLFLTVWKVSLPHMSDAVTGDLCRTLQFTAPVHNHSLSGHVIHTIYVTWDDSCLSRCNLREDCVSFNRGPLGNNKVLCELSDSDHLLHPEDVMLRPGFVYRGTENACASRPCSFNAQCLNGFSEKKYICRCKEGFHGENCESGESCRNIKTQSPNTVDGLYSIKPTSTLDAFPAYCDMTSFGGGWTMCYTTDDTVNPRTEVTYNEDRPYGTNGYRTDCNNIQFREILFVDEGTGQKAFFTAKSLIRRLFLWITTTRP